MDVSGQHHAPTTLPPGRNPCTPWIGSWVGLRAGQELWKSVVRWNNWVPNYTASQTTTVILMPQAESVTVRAGILLDLHICVNQYLMTTITRCQCNTSSSVTHSRRFDTCWHNFRCSHFSELQNVANSSIVYHAYLYLDFTHYTGVGEVAAEARRCGFREYCAKFLCYSYRAYSCNQYINQLTHLMKYIQKYNSPVNSYMFRHGGAIIRELFWQRSIRPARLPIMAHRCRNM
jgi:hypothetical protein